VPATEAPVADPDGAVMPDLIGKGLRPALALLAGLDVDVEIAGRGVVIRQDPPAGTVLAPGSACRLELAPLAAPATWAGAAR
jgi:beta-lactam-binding protein with PASTA domain